MKHIHPSYLAYTSITLINGFLLGITAELAIVNIAVDEHSVPSNVRQVCSFYGGRINESLVPLCRAATTVQAKYVAGSEPRNSYKSITVARTCKLVNE